MNRQSTTAAWMIDPQQCLIGNKNCIKNAKKMAPHFRLPMNLYSKVTYHHFVDTNLDDDDDDDDSTTAQAILSRRSMLQQQISLVASMVALTGTLSVANADDAVDPLAQMDAIAAQINGGSAGSGGAVTAGLGSDSIKRSGYPDSISPLPTAKFSEYDLVNDPPDVGSTKGGRGGGGGSTDLQKALKESQSRKKIDPRTHG